MKRAVLLLALFLTISIALPAQTLKRSVVGAGGFMEVVTGQDGKPRIKTAGMMGQAATGAYSLAGSGVAKVYIGFWGGKFKPVGIEDEVTSASGVSNFPNPASTQTTFRFNLSQPSAVTINVYNSIGALVATIIQDENYGSGPQSVHWNINGLLTTAGAYSYELLATPTAFGSQTLRYRNFLVIAN